MTSHTATQTLPPAEPAVATIPVTPEEDAAWREQPVRPDRGQCATGPDDAWTALS